MSHCLLLLTFSWLGSASLQFISAVEPRGEAYFDTFDPSSNNHPPLPYKAHNNYHPKTLQDTEPSSDNYNYADYPSLELGRQRRSIRENSRTWPQNQISDLGEDTGERSSFVIQGYSGEMEDNTTQMYTLDKRNFSPWGGKRADIPLAQMWTWKRGMNTREPSMPKRVRFSPWGGKRSGQLVYKPGQKGSRVIFSTVMPDLTRLISIFSPNDQRLALAGLHMLPMMDKRYPMNLMAVSTKLDNAASREAMPFKTFLDNLPRLFKVGHPYADINLKKDGKRKVKFSAWGGKRSPPIIGPIWTPAPDDLKASTLNDILLIKNSGLNSGRNELTYKPE